MADLDQTLKAAAQESASRTMFLVREILRRGGPDAANLLANEPEQTVASVLTLLPKAKAMALLPRFDAARRAAILKAVTPEHREQWLHNQRAPGSRSRA